MYRQTRAPYRPNDGIRPLERPLWSGRTMVHISMGPVFYVSEVRKELFSHNIHRSPFSLLGPLGLSTPVFPFRQSHLQVSKYNCQKDSGWRTLLSRRRIPTRNVNSVRLHSRGRDGEGGVPWLQQSGNQKSKEWHTSLLLLKEGLKTSPTSLHSHVPNGHTARKPPQRTNGTSNNGSHWQD